MLKNRRNTGPSSVSISAFTPYVTHEAGVITSFYRWRNWESVKPTQGYSAVSGRTGTWAQDCLSPWNWTLTAKLEVTGSLHTICSRKSQAKIIITGPWQQLNVSWSSEAWIFPPYHISTWNLPSSNLTFTKNFTIANCFPMEYLIYWLRPPGERDIDLGMEATINIEQLLRYGHQPIRADSGHRHPM